jgi:DNA end-binding protein Ku
MEIVEKKVAGEEIEFAPQAAPAKVVDLMEALKASVAAAKQKTPSAKPKPSAGRKTAAKAAAKKSTTTRKKAAAG